MRPFFHIIVVLFAIGLLACHTADQSDQPLEAILNLLSEETMQVLNDPKHEIQILYTQVDRDENNFPTLTSHFYNFDQNKYYYPASTVKMPVAFLAIQRINELRESNSDISIYTRMKIDSVQAPQTPVLIDSASATKYPNVATYVKKIFSVSDNDAYNRLYEFLGQDYINDELKSKGIFSNSRIRTRVGISGFDTESNKYTNPVQLISDEDSVLYEQDELYALHSSFEGLNETQKGKGYLDNSTDSIIMEPFDMSEKNFITIRDLEQSLQRIIFPELFDKEARFNYQNKDYEFLYDIMPKYPLEFEFNRYPGNTYYDSYVKFFYNGDSKDPIPEHIKIFNKVGWAYGTLTDCSYIIDLKNKTEFFLTATIHVNENQIFNDGNYEYESIGLPFLAALGKACYDYELKRPRTYQPDLTKFN